MARDQLPAFLVRPGLPNNAEALLRGRITENSGGRQGVNIEAKSQRPLMMNPVQATMIDGTLNLPPATAGPGLKPQTSPSPIEQSDCT